MDEAYGVATNDKGVLFLGACRNNNYPTITALDSMGNTLWYDEFREGSSWSGTWEVQLFPDGTGDILIGGCLNWTNSKAFMRRYTQEGKLVWENLLYNNTSQLTNGKTVAIDQDGNCYQIGYTTDSLFSEPIGNKDGFIIKIEGENTAPDTSTIVNTLLPAYLKLNQTCPNPF